MHKLTIFVLPRKFAICKLAADAEIPAWAWRGEFYSITRTSEELSIITLDRDIPDHITCDHDWRALKVEGPLEFSLTGVLESIARPLAEANISIFAVATYNTDYVLVKADRLSNTRIALAAAGHVVTEAE